MRVEDALPDISGLGVSSSNLRCLLLLPLAYVAASSGRRERRDLNMLFETTLARARLDGDAIEAARRWLRQTPSAEQFRAGLTLLRGLRDAREPVFSPADLLESLVWASSAAQLDRECVGAGEGPISGQARRAMRELEARLDVDVGELWADVLAELGEELPRSGNLVPPRFKTLPESRRDLLPASDPGPLIADYAAPASIPFPLVRRPRERHLEL